MLYNEIFMTIYEVGLITFHFSGEKTEMHIA